MKHLLFTLTFLFCLNSYSQDKNWTTHDGKSLSELPAYIQVVKEWGNNPTPATVYYGGEETFKRINRVPIMLNGKEYRFNDIMEVVNVFHYYGYYKINILCIMMNIFLDFSYFCVYSIFKFVLFYESFRRKPG